jgi:hypothetical protein
VDKGSDCVGGACADATECKSVTCKDTSNGGLSSCAGVGGCQDSTMGSNCYKDQCKSGHNYIYRCNAATDKCVDTGSNCASGTCNSAGTACQGTYTCHIGTSSAGGPCCFDATKGDSDCYASYCSGSNLVSYSCVSNKCTASSNACTYGCGGSPPKCNTAPAYTCNMVGGNCCKDDPNKDCLAPYCSGSNLVSYSCVSNKCAASSKACQYGCSGSPPYAACKSASATPCGNACSNTGKTYKDYLCKNNCDTWDDHVSQGDSWCASTAGKSLCCCNRG